MGLPDDLRDAHHALDKAVDVAYGYRGGKDDPERIAFLFTLYRTLEAELLPASKAGGKRRKAKRPAAERV